MAYAEIKGRCGGAKGCKELAISGTAKAPTTTERQAPRPGEETVYSPKKYRETEGIKDIESFKDSEFRKATAEEIADEGAEGYIMGLRLDSGGSKVFKVLDQSAYISREAFIRDAEETDTDTFLVQTAPYSKETITPSGNYTLTESGGSKKYSFPGGYERGSLGYGSTSKTVDARYQIVYTVSSNGSTVLSSGGSAYYNLSASGGSGKTLIGNYGGVNIFGNVISGPVYKAHNKSTVIVRKLVNGSWVTQTDPGSGSVTFNIYAGGSVQGGSVTIDPSTAPTLRAKVLVPAVMQKETTTEKRYAPWRYIPSEKSAAEKILLVKTEETS